MKDPRNPTLRGRLDRDANVQARKIGRATRVYRPQRVGNDQAQGHHHQLIRRPKIAAGSDEARRGVNGRLALAQGRLPWHRGRSDSEGGRMRFPGTRWATLVVAAGLFAAACGGGAEETTTTTTSLAAESSTTTVAETTTTTTTTESSGAVSGLKGVRGAVVRIVAEGSFVDIEEGLVKNAAGSGSGFIIDPSGLAVTNNHVVRVQRSSRYMLRVKTNRATPRSSACPSAPILPSSTSTVQDSRTSTGTTVTSPPAPTCTPQDSLSVIRSTR